jgi:hypothetical protein
MRALRGGNGGRSMQHRALDSGAHMRFLQFSIGERGPDIAMTEYTLHDLGSLARRRSEHSV